MRRVWNNHLDNILRRHFPKGDLDELAKRMGMTRAAIKGRARALGLRRKTNTRRPWGKWQLAYLRKHYADMSAMDISLKVRRSVSCVYNMANKLGLKKPKEFYQKCGRRVAASAKSQHTRFQPGHVPYSKGKRLEDFMSAEGIAKSSRTRFQPGQRPHNVKDVGYERIDKRQGYVFIKIAEGKPMVLKHRYIWEQHHGQIPEGYTVSFRDGNPQNCNIENLYLLSREDNARRRIASETPEARKARIEKTKITRAKNIRRDRLRIHWGMEPIGKLVKRW